MSIALHQDLALWRQLELEYKSAFVTPTDWSGSGYWPSSCPCLETEVMPFVFLNTDSVLVFSLITLSD